MVERGRYGDGGDWNQAVSVWALLSLKCLLDSRWGCQAGSVTVVSSTRGVARQEVRMWEPSARGWYLNPADWMRCLKEPIEREGKAVCVCVLVCCWGGDGG